MSSTRFRRAFDVSCSGGTIALFTAFLISGCVDLEVLTAPSRLILTVDGGDGQTGLVGWDLEQPIVVSAKDDQEAPVRGLTIRFATGAGGLPSPASAITDSLGRVSTTWRLSPSQVGAQTLSAGLVWAFHTPEVSVAATAIGGDQADVVVVHGALGPLKGAALSEADGSFDGAIGSTWSDTIFPVPPNDAPGRELVVFGKGNRPALVAPSWTPGADTVHVVLEPPITLDIAFQIRQGDFARRKEQMLAQVDTAIALWTDAGMGIRIGDVTFADSTGAVPLRLTDAPECPPTQLGDRVRVTVVTDIDFRGGGSVWGMACSTGDVYLVPRFWAFPYSRYTLVHEIGHTFSLRHTLEGPMHWSPYEQAWPFHDGEVFIAHFGEESILNTIYGSEPSPQRRNCDDAPEMCLPPLFQLGGG
jgi:hypothetical protein